MLKALRDTAALIELEQRLQRVREAQLRAVHDGRPLSPQELQRVEDDEVERWKRDFFCATVRQVFLPPGSADSITDPSDFQGRELVDAEQCVFDAHRHLMTLPIVGAAEHRDPGAAPTTDAGRA